MKKKFSIHWKGSKQPRKQRKYRANAPLHVKHKMISSNFSKELRKKHGKRNFPVRKGDNIRIMKGEFKGKTGKIDTINLKKMKIVIEGIYRTKKDGTKVSVYFDPSNLQIKELNLEDIKRKKSLERNGSKKSENKKEGKTGDTKQDKPEESQTSEKKSDMNLKKLPKSDKEDKKENAPK